ncbi:MAG: polysaccharide pyruvyl transferase family protein [Lachnospiraceae bacterium]|nr:polysaccharide pyruvyl transferase family protein [Lachnospiraceae bacterium]
MKNRVTAGIITYHEPYSYGANLQCLGLQMFLEELGFQPEIIDYSTTAYLELRRRNRVKSLLYRVMRFLRNPKGFLRAKKNAQEVSRESQDFQGQLDIRNRKFREFQQRYYHLSSRRYEQYSELRENCPVYDAYICGSDQIWNPAFCDMDDNYFLAFAPMGKRIAYAPSFGVRNISKCFQKEYRKRLCDIDCLSTREKEGVQIIKELTGRESKIVIDPTLLIDREQWMKIADDSDAILPETYILTYFIGMDEYIEQFQEEVRRAFPKDEIVNLVFDKSSYGPCDFLKLLSQAKFVFTNSFHGLAFCINLNVPFAVGKTLKDYGSTNSFVRMEDLLENLGLEHRIYNGRETLGDSWLKLDFTEVNKKRKQFVQESRDYLRNALEQVTS